MCVFSFSFARMKSCKKLWSLLPFPLHNLPPFSPLPLLCCSMIKKVSIDLPNQLFFFLLFSSLSSPPLRDFRITACIVIPRLKKEEEATKGLLLFWETSALSSISKFSFLSCLLRPQFLPPPPPPSSILSKNSTL